MGVDPSLAPAVFHPWTPAAPGTPAITPGDGQLTVKWEAVTGATLYDVYYSTSGSPPATPAQQDINATSCTITGLTNGTTYYVWIKAKNNIGTSDFSPEASGTPIPVPAAPAAPALTAGDQQITVNWSPVTGATSYQVWYGTSSSSGSASQYGSDITGTTCTITGLTNGTLYYVWVKAKNSAGLSAFSPFNSIWVPVSIGEIAGGTGSYADGDWISFGKTFSTVPVVVVNAYDATGKPLIAGVRTEPGSRTTTGFNIKIHDLDGEGGTPVSSATVQWVAIIPNFSAQVQVQTGYGLHYDGVANAFSSPNPIVICSAYDDTMQYPIMAAPYNIYSNKFTVSLKDADGIQSMAYVSYIALVPPTAQSCFDRIKDRLKKCEKNFLEANIIMAKANLAIPEMNLETSELLFETSRSI